MKNAKKQTPAIPQDIRTLAADEETTTDTMSGILRLLALLGSCGLSAGAPPILHPVENRG